MGFSEYSRWTAFDWDELDLQRLMGELSDHLLESGFQKQFEEQMRRYFQGEEDEFSEEDEEDPLSGLRSAIREILRESDLLSEQQKQQFFDKEGNVLDERLEQLIDQLIAKLLEQGFLNLSSEGEVVQWRFNDEGRLELVDPGTGEAMGRGSKKQVKVSVSKKGMDFLGHQSLRQLLGGFGSSSFGGHRTERSSAGYEAYEASKPYEFGDTLQLDPSKTVLSAVQRQGSAEALDLTYDDLWVRQSSYYSSCATVLLIDCSHSMILYGEDRFTPAKRVALALAHLIRTQFPGDTLRVVLFHDAAEEIPLAKLAEAQVGPYHTNTCEGLKLARRILNSQRKEKKQILMITDGKPSALFLGDAVAVGRGSDGSDLYGRRLYKNSMGLDPMIVKETLREADMCRRDEIMLNTFMITDDYYLVRFVERLTLTAAGQAYFAAPTSVGSVVMQRFLSAKRK